MANDTQWFHELTTDEAKEERLTLAQRLIAILGVLCGAVLILIAATWPHEARAQEVRAADPGECALFADYGITSRALVITGIEFQKRLEILGQMYDLKDERMRALAKIVRQAADKSDKGVQDFAGQVYGTCMNRAGDISGLLGPAS